MRDPALRQRYPAALRHLVPEADRNRGSTSAYLLGNLVMPLLVLVLAALATGGLVAFVARHYPASATRPSAAAVARAAGHKLGHHQRLLHAIERGLSPKVASGLALAIAFGLVLAGGLLFGALAYLLRTSSMLADLDASVAQWGADHAGDVSDDTLNLITHLGGTEVVVFLAIVVGVAEYVRKPNRWIAPFLVVVLLGQNLLTNGIKELLDRARPTLNPIAETLGPSFPSGHSATAAAFWAACALLIGRGRSKDVRAMLAGAAAAIAVAVACTRVLLDLHWLSDVIAGLILGWTWFAVSAIAFGGRVLHLGAAVTVAEDVADQAAEPPTAAVQARPGRAESTG